MDEFENLKKKFFDLKAKRDYLLVSQTRLEEDKKELEEYYKNALEARVIIQTVSKNTQKKLEDKFNNLVTMALSAVFPDDLKFQIEFVTRRNKTEADVWIIKNGHKQDIWSGGGGPLNVMDFACRVAFWSLKKDKRSLFFLDETFSFLNSHEFQKNASQMISELSKTLGIQIILITDKEDIIGNKEYEIIDGNAILIHE